MGHRRRTRERVPRGRQDRPDLPRRQSQARTGLRRGRGRARGARRPDHRPAQPAARRHRPASPERTQRPLHGHRRGPLRHRPRPLQPRHHQSGRDQLRADGRSRPAPELRDGGRRRRQAREPPRAGPVTPRDRPGSPGTPERPARRADQAGRPAGGGSPRRIEPREPDPGRAGTALQPRALEARGPGRRDPLARRSGAGDAQGDPGPAGAARHPRRRDRHAPQGPGRAAGGVPAGDRPRRGLEGRTAPAAEPRGCRARPKR